jgi:hypothetical protein
MAAAVWMSREKTLIRNSIWALISARSFRREVLLTAEQPRRDVGVNESFR